MVAALLPLISVATATGAVAAGVPSETITSPRAAQARLAASLASATSIDTVTANDRAVTFTLDHANQTTRLVVQLDPNGTVESLTLTILGPAKAEGGSLTWLTAALADTAAITTLAVDHDGRVRLGTDRGDDFLLLASREERVTNVAVEARWAAAWDWQ
jgi:hypothetical protein